jgi:hypothetical protein
LEIKTARVSIAARSVRRLLSEARQPQLDLRSVLRGIVSMEAILDVFCDAHWPVSKSARVFPPESARKKVREDDGGDWTLTNGSPQYVHIQTCGLSVLIKILGCPSGPPPPSQATTLSCVHRTGCLCINSIAAEGCGCNIVSQTL